MKLPAPLRRITVAIAFGLLPLATPAYSQHASPPPVAIGQPLPNAFMTGLNGPVRSIHSFRGRPLIVNVWASWCGPCRAEAASLERLARSEAGRRYTVIGISTDDHRENAIKWLAHSKATLLHFIDRAPHWPLEHMMGASAIPVTVLVDANGRVVARIRGAREWDTAESIGVIERAFKGTQAK
jgi:thiol-disulfide isomerase/thioredoxin